jgi:formamidopyrimidine-DNA glycosylase
MPELPEVETIRRDLAALLVGRKVSAVQILSAKTAQPNAAFFIKHLSGRKLVGIERRGKLLIFRLNPVRLRPDYLLIHLKMTGQLIYIDRKARVAGGHSLESNSVGGELPNKHTRAIIGFTGGGRLFFNDLRKFGYLKLVSRPELEKILDNNYGPEPLTKTFTADFLSSVLRGRKIKIKAALLDQKLIAGLGNIYVDESLYAARIKPQRLAGSLKPAETRKLWSEINRIIKKAIEYRGTTFSDYVDSRGRKGNFSRWLQVYGRKGGACPNCHKPLLKTKVAGRGTHYCQYCQK